jgi:hypothetical protein
VKGLGLALEDLRSFGELLGGLELPAPSVVIIAILIFVVMTVSSLACAEATPTPPVKRRAPSVKPAFCSSSSRLL